MKLPKLARATVRIVSPKQLIPGDCILRGDHSLKVIEINKDTRQLLIERKPEKREWIRFTRVVYVIESRELLAEEIQTRKCHWCEKEFISEYEESFCSTKCYDEWCKDDTPSCVST